MKSKLQQLCKKAQEIVDGDSQLRKMQDSFKELGLSEAESPAATLVKKFSETQRRSARLVKSQR